MKCITGIPIKKISSIAGIGLGIIVFVPVIDFIINHGYLITYPLRLQPYLLNFFNPCASLVDVGISPGQRIIVFCIILLIAMYTYSKSRSLFRTILGLLISAIVILLWGGLSTIIAHNVPEHLYIGRGFLFTDTQKFASLYGLLLIILLVGYFFLYDKLMFRRITASLRVERMVFFGGMTVFGYIYARHLAPGYVMQPFDLIAVIILFLIFALAFWLVQVINDFFDLNADRISRPRNPLLNLVAREQYMNIAIVLTLVVLSLALIVNYTVFLLTAVFIVLGFMYSVPVVRIKQVPIVATFIHACAVLAATAAGFSLFHGSHALHQIPGHVLIPMLISITLGFTAKDINDRAADQQAGTITLPVLIYDEHTMIKRVPMALIVGFSYIVFSLFMPPLLPGALLFAILSAGIITVFKKVKEIVFFVLLYAFGFYLLVMLLRYY